MPGLVVNAAFLQQLRADSVDLPALVQSQAPARAWHEEKLRTFLTQLKAQLPHETVRSP